MQYYLVHNVGIFIIDPWSRSQDGPGIFGQQYRVPGHPDLIPVRCPGAIQLPGVYDLSGIEKITVHHPKDLGYEVKPEFADVMAKAGKSEFYPKEEIVTGHDADYDPVFVEWWKDYAPFYRVRMSERYETWENVSAEFKQVGEFTVDGYENPSNMTVRSHTDDQWRSPPVPKVEAPYLGDVVTLNQLNAFMVPQFLHHTQPCKLTGKQLYQIVRAHVKEHINPKRATITSDYDFCFTVKRKNYHAKPVVIRTEIRTASGRSYKVPKFQTKTEEFKYETIFEMSWNGAGSGGRGPYTGYTALEGLEADNLQDMHDRITLYLEHLMANINAHVQCCPTCDGKGFTESPGQFKTHKL